MDSRPATGCCGAAEGAKGWKRSWVHSPEGVLPLLVLGDKAAPTSPCLHVRCLGKHPIITLMGKDIPKELAVPSPDNSARSQGRGELPRCWEGGYTRQLELKQLVGSSMENFFSYLL